VKKLGSILVAAALLVPTQALADGGRFRDPDEQPFCETPDPCPDTDYIDFRKVTYGHGRSAGILRHGIVTRERWKTKDMGGPHGVTIYLELDVDGDRTAERMLRMRRKDGELRARMFRGKHLRKAIGGSLRVWRPNQRSIKVRFPLRLLGDDLDRYRWSAGWYNRNVGCAGSCHTDYAPHRGRFEHRL
jgi:hypothetical protein